MSEIGEMWNDIRKERQEKRHFNQLSSTEILRCAGVRFKSFNAGVQLNLEDFPYFFWPSTGLFIHRETQQRGRGVFKLLKKIGVKYERG